MGEIKAVPSSESGSLLMLTLEKYTVPLRNLLRNFFWNNISLPKELMNAQRCKHNSFQGMDEFRYFHEINKYELL